MSRTTGKTGNDWGCEVSQCEDPWWTVPFQEKEDLK